MVPVKSRSKALQPDAIKLKVHFDGERKPEYPKTVLRFMFRLKVCSHTIAELRDAVDDNYAILCTSRAIPRRSADQKDSASVNRRVAMFSLGQTVQITEINSRG